VWALTSLLLRGVMMSRFGEFGQAALTEIFSLANQAKFHAANAMLARRRQKGEEKLSLRELAQKERLYKMDLSMKEQELAAKMGVSQRRDSLFKDIALYAGIGIGALVILITLGVMFVGAKRESQFEYLIEEAK